jgi:hypothetical protein
MTFLIVITSSKIPPAGMVRLTGLTDEQLAVSLDPLPPSAATVSSWPVDFPTGAA